MMTLKGKPTSAFAGLRHCRWAIRLCAAVLYAATQSAQGGVVLENTRVVYPLGEREVSFQVSNGGNASSLVQSWIDAGDPASNPSSAKLPLVVVPPIFTIGAGRSRALSIIYTGDPLPQDRESVYWLNVLDVPSAAKDESANTLGLAFRIRVKVFVRPKGLEGSPSDAPGQLRWTLVDAAEGKSQGVRVKNPTPFHVSLRSFEILDNGGTFGSDQGAMVAPRSEAVLAVPNLGTVGQGAMVRFVAIDDDSAPLPGQAPLGVGR